MNACTIVHEIAYREPLSLFALFAGQKGAILLESTQLREASGRYSFIAVDPFLFLSSKNGQMTLGGQPLKGDPFHVLAEQLAKFPQKVLPGLPPFQGGAAGFLSYELAHHLEKLPRTPSDDMNFPDMAIGFYDVVLAFDEKDKRAFIFSNGYPLKNRQARKVRAKERLQLFLNQLEEYADLSSFDEGGCQDENIHSNFTRDHYLQAVQKVKQYILEGDIFEANISQRFYADLPSHFNAFHLYQRLRAINPAPFSAYVHFDDVTLVSASPERFLQLKQNHVEARPIKGTVLRGKNEMEDVYFAEKLLASEKDKAENVMIVDLLRNDLSRVCEDHSVKVPQLCGLESYPTVHHLVSVITGKLKPFLTAIDLLRATFPGGSVTGAPKIRAMGIISEIEPTLRGPYCGSIGYIGFNGDMDFSITIRTFAIKNNKVTFQAGGAVVLDSDPSSEYEETLLKACALRKALVGGGQ